MADVDAPAPVLRVIFVVFSEREKDTHPFLEEMPINIIPFP